MFEGQKTPNMNPSKAESKTIKSLETNKDIQILPVTKETAGPMANYCTATDQTDRTQARWTSLMTQSHEQKNMVMGRQGLKPRMTVLVKVSSTYSTNRRNCHICIILYHHHKPLEPHYKPGGQCQQEQNGKN
jgi:hypothetical protein